MEDLSDQNKLFVGGVSWETTEETLRAHFEKYGTVLHSTIAKDRITGVARGFAFVTFSDPSGVEAALKASHEICGRTVEVKKAIPRSEQQSKQGRSNYRSDQLFRTKKIFVGGLSANLTEEEFKDYFEKYGRITDVVVMHDIAGRPRGFGFITFATEDAVEQVVQNNFHKLNDKSVEVKRAVPKDGNSYGGSNGSNVRAKDGRISGYRPYQGTFPHFSPGIRSFLAYGPYPSYGGVAGYPYGPSFVGGSYPPYGGYVGFGFGGPPWFNMRVGGPTPSYNANPPPFRI